VEGVTVDLHSLAVEGVVDVALFGVGEPRVAIEVPHGASGPDDYEAVARRLRSPLPDDLQAFYCVNTDVGSSEAAFAIAGQLADPHASELLRQALRVLGSELTLGGAATVVVRSRIPRTFVDCNRLAGTSSAALKAGALTGLMAEYVTDPSDQSWLLELHAHYAHAAEAAFAQVCGNGGVGVSLHTYAPRSVGITTVDAGIVAALRAAYVPETYAQWPERPAVDLIHAATDGAVLLEPHAQADLVAGYRALGHEPGLSATYKLHPGTFGEKLARLYPLHTISLELRRDLLADPWDPFTAMRIDPARAEALAAPLSATLLRMLNR
jgi:hypothetical protein